MILAASFTGSTTNAIGSIVVTTDSRVFTLTADQAGFDKVLEHLKAGENDQAEALLDRLTLVKTAVENSKFEIEGNMVTFNGRNLPTVMADYVLRIKANGMDLAPLERFAENLYQNPSFKSIQECFKFIEANQMPITEDGCFIGYRAVTKDYRDIRTGTFDNSIGKKVKEDRNLVDDDPTNTCSNGLHVCSLEYISTGGWGYHDSPWIIVKVNPRDVVTVPNDYHNTKMRVCEFDVIGELDRSKIGPKAKKSYREDSPVFQPTDQELIAAGKFYELGQKHRNKNDERGSGKPLAASSFTDSHQYYSYVDGYCMSDKEMVRLGVEPKRNYCDKLKYMVSEPLVFNPHGYDQFGYRRSGYNRKGLNRGGLTKVQYERMMDGHDMGFYLANGQKDNSPTTGLAAPWQTATAPIAPDEAQTAHDTNSDEYALGKRDGLASTSFQPRNTNTEYWNGYCEGWKLNPNRQF